MIRPLPTSRCEKGIFVPLSAHRFVRRASAILVSGLTLSFRVTLSVASENAAVASLLGRLDRTQRTLAARLIDTVERFDQFFGDERLNEEADQTRFSVQLGLLVDEKEGARLEQRFRLHLELPNLQRHLLLFLEDAFESENPSRPSALVAAAGDSRPLAGLRLAFTRLGRFRAQADAGARLGSESQAFLRGRLSLLKTREVWECRLTQTVTWFTRDGWVVASEARWTQSLAGDRLLRSTTRLEWREDSDGVAPSQSVEFFQAVGRQRGHRFAVRGRWPETSHCHSALYSADYTLRLRLGRDWLYLDMGPGVEFAQDRDYRANPFALVRLECLFGKE